MTSAWKLVSVTSMSAGHGISFVVAFGLPLYKVKEGRRGLVDPREVVVHEVEADRMRQVLDLL